MSPADKSLLTLVGRANRSLGREIAPDKAIAIMPAPEDNFTVQVIEIAGGVCEINFNGKADAVSREDVSSAITDILGREYGGEICCRLKQIEPNHCLWIWFNPQTWQTFAINGMPSEEEFFETS